MSELKRPSISIVATPIGNLDDISPRALSTLQSSDLLLVEDYRVSKRLLDKYGIATPVQSFNEHNENAIAEAVVRRVKRESLAIAIISDAGMPVISDPGYPLIARAHELDITVTAVPGPCAAVTALAMSGLPAANFVFAGFLPPKRAARERALKQLAEDTRTIIFYEAPHRLRACLADALTVIGPERDAFIARELTKSFESTYRGTLTEVVHAVARDAYASRGELVVVLGPTVARHPERAEIARILTPALRYLSRKDAVALTSEVTGARRNSIYQLSLALKPPGSENS